MGPARKGGPRRVAGIEKRKSPIAFGGQYLRIHRLPLTAALRQRSAWSGQEHLKGSMVKTALTPGGHMTKYGRTGGRSSLP